MTARFIRWAILIAIFLVVCSGIGVAVREAIPPHPVDYTRMYGSTYGTRYSPPATTTTMPQPEIRKDAPQLFQAMRGPTADESAGFISLIQTLQRSHLLLKGNNTWNFTNQFDADRMAEEWSRFGIDEIFEDGENITQNAAAMAIRDQLAKRAAEDAESFRDADESTIVWIAFSIDNTDVCMLIKHVARTATTARTWFTRYWLHYRFGAWQFYDYEEQPHRLRVNAILASNAAQRKHRMFLSDPAERTNNTNFLVARATQMMTDCRPIYGGPPNTLKFVKFVKPLEAVRIAIDIQPEQTTRQVQSLDSAITLWSGNPVVYLMAADAELKPARLDLVKKSFGSSPWLAILRAKSMQDKATAKKTLETELTANTGHPLLLNALFEYLSPTERGALGTQAARGPSPAAALKLLMDEHSKDRESLLNVVEAFRAIRPVDSEGCYSRAVLAVGSNDFRTAREMLELVFAESNAKTQSEYKSRFLAYCTGKLGKSKDDLLQEPELGALLK